MQHDQQDRRPYLDWELDRMKIGLVLLLFILLILLPFITPLDTDSDTQTPVEQTGLAAVSGTEPAGTPQTGAMGEAPNSAQDSADGVDPEGADTGGAASSASTDMPLTLALLGPNAVVLPQSMAHLEGTAAPGKLVEIRVQFVPAQATAPTAGAPGEERVLGTSLANKFGLWMFATAEEFASGQYVVTLRQLNLDGQIELISSPVVVTVLPEGEVGPPALGTPMIRFPSTAAQLREGTIVFDGTGLPGSRLQLFVDSRLRGETFVGRDGEWQLTLPDGLGAGVYVAQVAMLEPSGDVIAESAPVAFAVVDAPLGFAGEEPENEPLLPLRLSHAQVAVRPHDALILTGVATPHSSVAAWVDGTPVRYANTRIDGGWRLWFLRYLGTDAARSVEVRSHLSEVIQIEQTAPDSAPAHQYEPIFLFPTAGEILTTRRPLLFGVAPPRTELSLLVNDVLVASVVTDAQGQWAYQVEEPLPSGRVALTAALGVRHGRPDSDTDKDAVTVTVAPQL